MTFMYPLGLLGLIGIPILIIVYLIKNRYTEQTVASTFLWTLSEKFLKKRNPLSKITGIISLVLQLLLVVTLSLAVARPVIVLSGAAHEYCIILDCSASMNMQKDGQTRFDVAKEEVLDIVKDAKDGSTFTVVLVGSTTEVIVENSNSKSKVSERVSAVKCTDGSADFADAMSIAQGYFNDNPSTVTYLVTDVDYKSADNVKLVNVARSEWNVSIEDVSYVKNGKKVAVTGNVISYGAEGTVELYLYADSSNAELSKTVVQTTKEVPAGFSFVVDLDSFYSLKVEANIDDAYAKDNVAIIYDVESENSYNALLVSDSPFLLKATIESVSNAKVTVMSTKDYKTEEDRAAGADMTVSGYSLYIFDSYTPVLLPRDGSVWLLGSDANVPGSGFSVQGEVVLADQGDVISMTKSTSSLVRKLLDGIIGDEIYVKQYVKCGLYADFTTLFSYNGNPVIFTGMNDYGNREVVFAFSVHDTNMTLYHDYLCLVGNLLDYSFPEVIESTEYYCGQTAEINVISGCDSIRVETPLGQIIYTDLSSAVSEFKLTEVGEYKITVSISGSERPDYYIYSSVPTEERIPDTSLEYVGILGEASEKGSDGWYDPITLLLVVVALLFTAEWMVYCYDKYQLR